ncbi:MAG: sterol desaturase family protein [Bacteroidota bacterium]|nr:sterol desaturase family protein [Bacteroidota bacterium]MDX5430520.1 sterol desaturase family protein [Bacteroidota bacterium]MDX5469273.1 sterol desaturase family protein [Bacteroidota bacterium]
MSIALGIGITFLSFWFMEFMAWFTHRFVMHGFMWHVHRDHHQGSPGFFEKNDLFFLIFAVPSWLFMMFGMMAGNDWRLYVGLGILLYGIAYFLVHEVIIHQRFKWFRNLDNTYVKAIRRAHKMHHKHLNKEDGESFGMLIVGKKYWEMVRKQ